MATIIINTTLDKNDGSIDDGDVSLRAAIAFADRQAGADTITFASGPGEAFEGGGTIRLDAAAGGLVRCSDVAIDGGDQLDRDGGTDREHSANCFHRNS